MHQGIGTLLTKLREEKGYTQEQLCKGICSVSKLAKIEKNITLPDYFQLDRLFARLGKSTERLEYVLPRDIYELYELQYRIQAAICHLEFPQAEALLLEYAGKRPARQKIHQQFIEQERAQIAWIRGENAEDIMKHLQNTIEATIPMEKPWESGIALSAEEMKLLLFRWEAAGRTELPRNPQELWDILHAVEKYSLDAEEKVKVYPYAVLLLAERYGIGENRHYIKPLLEESLELLREEGRILYLPETLEVYARLLEEEGANPEQIEELQEMREALLKLEGDFGMHFEQYRLFQHLNRAFELDYEMIRRSRLACHMSQEELCEGICTQETLSRIERGKHKPNGQILKKLLEKMNRKRERVGMYITTERFEVIALERRIARAIHRFEYEEAEELLEKLKREIDMSVLENQQYIAMEQILIEEEKGEITYKQAVEQLWELLKLTLNDIKENILSHRLTYTESITLNLIAALWADNDEKEKGITLWKKMLQNYRESDVHPAFRIRNWELFMGNLAGDMSDLKYMEEPLAICRERLRVGMEVGKGNELGRSVTIIGCVMETKQDPSCPTYFKRALAIQKLMKMEYRYQCVKEYAEKNGIL